MFVTKNHHNNRKKITPKENFSYFYPNYENTIYKKTRLYYKNHRKRDLMNNAKFCEFVFCYFHLFEKNASIIVRGSSYGGELVRLDRLAHLSEISSSLRNSYKNIMCSYEKRASQPK